MDDDRAIRSVILRPSSEDGRTAGRSYPPTRLPPNCTDAPLSVQSRPASSPPKDYTTIQRYGISSSSCKQSNQTIHINHQVELCCRLCSLIIRSAYYNIYYYINPFTLYPPLTRKFIILGNIAKAKQ